MAVGSRQLLFSDALAPASPTDSSREVGALSDNREGRAAEPSRVSGTDDGRGQNIDVQA